MTLSRSARRVILGVLVVAFVVGAVILWRTGAVTPTSIRIWLDSLGSAAPVIFVGAFVGGALIGLPGIAFVIGGRLAFGPYVGFAVGYLGGVLAVTIPFLAARRLRKAGDDPWRPKQRHLAKLLGLVETHPFGAVFLLRVVFWFNPPLSYALAFGPVPTWAYVAGCAVAFVPVVAGAMIATGWFL